MTEPRGSMAARPIVQAFLVCREVLKDIRTGDHILLGPTTHLRLQQFPCRVAVMGFLQMVEAHGRYTLSASLQDSDGEQVWSWSMNEPLYHPEPLFIHQVVFGEWILSFPHPGRYRLELRANGVELAEQMLCAGPAEFFRAEQ